MSHDTQIVSTTPAGSSATPVVPALPVPKCDIAIRTATMADLPFLDGLQKKHTKQLGYFPTKQFEGYIEMGAVLVAEAEGGGVGVRVGLGVGSEGNPTRTHNPTPTRTRSPLGYIISRDRYLKRDELGVIYQLCVEPGTQRKLVGAALVKAVFDRSAYGCRLYSCWCAQDLEANYFWESLGFVPVAFRAGSTGKKRVHIFWQKRICEDDDQTRWWYPCQTNSGAIREDRLVFPIPPDVHWKDVKAVALPNAECRLPNGKPKALGNSKRNSAIANRKSAITTGPPPGKVGIVVGGRIKYIDRPGYVAPEPEAPIKPKRPAPEGRAKVKVDPKYLAAARELRDRYLEQINRPGGELVSRAKYHIARPATGGLGFAPELTRAPALTPVAGSVKRLPQAA